VHKEIGNLTYQSHLIFHLGCFFWVEIVGKLLSRTQDRGHRPDRRRRTLNPPVLVAFLVERAISVPRVKDSDYIVNLRGALLKGLRIQERMKLRMSVSVEQSSFPEKVEATSPTVPF